MTETKVIPVSLLDLKLQYATIRDEVRLALDRVIESQQFIMGPEVEALEREVAAYSQCSHAVGVSSGTDALLVVLMALGIGPGDEVITPAHSFFATAGCVTRLNARPVFVDIDPATYNLDPDRLEAAITERTRAVIPVHLYGQMTEMDQLMQIARRHRLHVIEDAAQAIGAEYKNRRAGSIGDFGCFSFFPSKNLGGFGDGGMVTTNDPELAEQVRLLRNHGDRPKYYHRVVGGNFRLDAIQAAVLRVKLAHLDEWIRAREHNAARYKALFEEAGIVANSERDGISLPVEAPLRRHTFNYFVIGTPRRNALRAFLAERQIGTEIYYPVPLHRQECFAALGYGAGDFPISEELSARSLALPIYPELTLQQQERVVQTIREFLSSSTAKCVGQ